MNLRNEKRELEACRAVFQHLRDQRVLNAKADETYQWCHAHDARILYPGHEDYPFNSEPFDHRPPFLACWGEPSWRRRPSIAVVGSREPSSEALSWMETHLVEFLRATSAVVVSGGARGIDQRAHRLAIRSGCPTVVFLPSGLACPYPGEWQNWKHDVLAGGGALLSHYPPFQEIRRIHFEERNRLIAALGKILLVVEARRRSGSSMTARLAADLGRTVCVLPGHPSDPRAGGTIDLLFDGAEPIRDATDLVMQFSKGI